MPHQDRKPHTQYEESSWVEASRDGHYRRLVEIDAPVTLDVDNAQSGALIVESFRDDVRINFSKSKGAASIADDMVDAGSVGGTLTHDTTEGRAVFGTGAAASNTSYFETVNPVVYEPGHTIRVEQTIEVNRALTGTDEVRWGIGDDDGSGDIDNGIGWGLDATGFFVWRRKNGTDELKEYSFNRDALDGNIDSKYIKAGSPVAIQAVQANNIFVEEFEWLGGAPPHYKIMAPSLARFISVHVEEKPNTAGTTIPDPELPLFVRAFNGSGTDLQVSVGSMRGGIITGKTVLQGERPDGKFSDLPASGKVAENSSTTTLGSAGVFTGDWVPTEGYSHIAVLVNSDVASADGGLVIEQSEDEATVHTSDPLTYDAQPNGRTYQVPVSAQFFRIRYTNGGTGQSTFTLASFLNISTTQASIIPVGQVVPDGVGGAVQRSIIEPVDNQKFTRTPVGTSAVQLATTPLTRRVTYSLKAHPSNTGILYYANSSSQASTTGDAWPLAAGDSVDVELGPDAPEIWVVSSKAGDVVYLMEIAEV